MDQNSNKFAEYLGFKHRKITPLWPKANAESERFMRTIEKTIRAAKCGTQKLETRNLHISKKLQSYTALHNKDVTVRNIVWTSIENKIRCGNQHREKRERSSRRK